MTEVPLNKLDLLEAYEHKIYCRVRQTGTSILMRLQDGEDPRNVFTPSGLPRCPPYPLCCRLCELGELGPGKILPQMTYCLGQTLAPPMQFTELQGSRNILALGSLPEPRYWDTSFAAISAQEYLFSSSS